MAQSPKPDQIKNETFVCKRNHIAIAAGLCLIPLIPALFGLAVGQHGEDRRDVTIVFVFWGIYLFALGVALWEAIDLIRNKGLSSCCIKGRIAVAAGLYLTSWVLALPGFIMPFCQNLIAVLAIIATTLWQAFGFILLIRAKSSMRSFLFILFFIFPASFLITLSFLVGPAFITILNAFCQTPR